MGRAQRSKGSRTERHLVDDLRACGIPASRISRTGYSGPDLDIAGQFLAEVKARKSGSGFTQLETWLGTADVLLLKRDRQPPMVTLTWAAFVLLMRRYVEAERAALPPT